MQPEKYPDLKKEECPLYVVAYFKLHGMDSSQPADSRAVAQYKRPELEICLIPEDKAIECMTEGLFRVPAGAISIRLEPGDPFPDVRNLSQYMWNPPTPAQREQRKDVSPQAKQLPAPEAHFLDELLNDDDIDPSER